MYPPPAVETAIPMAPAEFVPLAVTDEDAEDAEDAKSPAAEENLDDKKADASFIVLEEDDEEDAADIIGDGVTKDEET